MVTIFLPAMADAGWYPDPSGDGRMRWWDGNGWSEHTRAVLFLGRKLEYKGIATLVAFVGAGGIPLLPFIVLSGPAPRLNASIAVTFTTLFVIGALRAVVTVDRWWLSGLEMLLLGIAVALAAYGSGACAAWLLGGA